MSHYTSNTYQMKREILTFSNKISKKLSKPDRKFSADMIYGLLASQSCLLTDIIDQLHEPIQKVNSVERLTNHLKKGISKTSLSNYLRLVSTWVPQDPIIYIDDSDIVKPNGWKFEALGLVRDGSKSTTTKSVYEKGYHVTEACVLTKKNHPVSFFSNVHSSKEKNFTSINDITFSAIERATVLFPTATFVLDRGYDDNKIFLKLEELKQKYVIRLTTRRKLFFHGNWVTATRLGAQRKGKIKTSVFYKGKQQDIYLSHVKVQITASKQPITLVLVYGLKEQPMMLASNQPIHSKEDVIKIALLYFSRWKIEEYFRSKKQLFQWENFRVRTLLAINCLNFYITSCMAFLAHISMKSETNALKSTILTQANGIKKKIVFWYYRIAKGIARILSYAKEGVRLWFRTKRPKYQQLRLTLIL